MESSFGRSYISDPDRRLELVQFSSDPFPHRNYSNPNYTHIYQRAHILVACARKNRERHKRSLVHGSLICDPADRYANSHRPLSDTNLHSAFPYHRPLGDANLHFASHSDTNADCNRLAYEHPNPNHSGGR